MIIDWTLVVEAVKALAWPTVAAFALYLLRRPLIELVGQLARRASEEIGDERGNRGRGK